MNDLIEQTGTLLQQAKDLLNNPTVAPSLSNFLIWLGENVFSSKKSATDKLLLIKQQQADEKTIAKLTSMMELMLEDEEALCQELKTQIAAVKAVFKTANVEINTSKVTIKGHGNFVFQNVRDSNKSINITGNDQTYIGDGDQSVNITKNNQTHSGSGDIIGGNKITHNITNVPPKEEDIIDTTKPDPDPKDPWWKTFEKVAVELYPQGPGEQAIWNRAGGNIGTLDASGSGIKIWNRALYILRKGGGGAISPEALLTEMLDDYPQKAELQELLSSI